MSKLSDEYKRVCETPSDINEHCETLRNLASIHDHVVEMGVRYGVSTIALLSGHPKRLTSVDLRCQIDACGFHEMSESPTIFQFVVADSLVYTIDVCDLLFIDTYHTGRQLYAELNRHAPMVARTIVMHDTETFGGAGEDGLPGLTPAYTRYVKENPQWRVARHYENNNGLTILSRNILA